MSNWNSKQANKTPASGASECAILSSTAVAFLLFQPVPLVAQELHVQVPSIDVETYDAVLQKYLSDPERHANFSAEPAAGIHANEALEVWSSDTFAEIGLTEIPNETVNGFMQSTIVNVPAGIVSTVNNGAVFAVIEQVPSNFLGFDGGSGVVLNFFETCDKCAPGGEPIQIPIVIDPGCYEWNGIPICY